MRRCQVTGKVRLAFPNLKKSKMVGSTGLPQNGKRDQPRLTLSIRIHLSEERSCLLLVLWNKLIRNGIYIRHHGNWLDRSRCRSYAAAQYSKTESNDEKPLDHTRSPFTFASWPFGQSRSGLVNSFSSFAVNFKGQHTTNEVDSESFLEFRSIQAGVGTAVWHHASRNRKKLRLMVAHCDLRSAKFVTLAIRMLIA